MSDDEGLFTAPRGGAFPTAAPSEFVDFGWQDVSCSGSLMRAWISCRLPLLCAVAATVATVAAAAAPAACGASVSLCCVP